MLYTMSTMIQIRHVPEKVHRVLKARAAEAGMPLSDFLRHELETIAARPTLAELAARISHRESVKAPSSMKLIRKERNSHDRA